MKRNNPEYPAPSIDPSLKRAVDENNTPLVKALIAQKIDLTQRDHYALRHACNHGNHEMISAILDACPVRPSSFAFSLIIKGSSLETFQYVLQSLFHPSLKKPNDFFSYLSACKEDAALFSSLLKTAISLRKPQHFKVMLELILISDKASTHHLFCNLVSNDICEFDGFTEREYRSTKIIYDVLYETFYALYRLEDAETAKAFFASFVELKNVHPEVEKTINYCLTRSQQNSLQPHMSTKSYQSIMLFLDQHFTRDNDNRDNSPNVRTIFFEENNFYEAVEKGNQAFVTSFLEKIIFDRARPSYSFLFNFNLCFQALDVICKAIKYAAQHQQIEILKLFLNFFQPGTRRIYESFILHRVLLNCIELETADGNIEAMTLLIKKSQEFGHDYKYLFDKNSENDLGKFYQSIMKDIALAGQAPLLKMLVSGKILGHTALFPTNIKDALSQEVLKQKYYGVFFKQTMLEVVRGDRDAYQIMQVFLSEFSLLKIPLCDFFKYGMSAAGKGHAKIFELVLKQHSEKSNYQYINDIVFAYRAHGDLSYAPYSSTQDEDFDIYFAIEAAKNKKSNILECLFNKDRKIINKT